MVLKKSKKCGSKLIFPPKRWCGSDRGPEKVVWLCGLHMALDGTCWGDVYSEKSRMKVRFILIASV